MTMTEATTRPATSFGGATARSDGTVMIKDIRAGADGSEPSYLTNINGLLYFEANDGTHGQKLWTYAPFSSRFTVTPSAGTGGSISPATPQTVNHGATTSFTVTPDIGYIIDTVSGCGGTLSGNTYTTGAITANCAVTASFRENNGWLAACCQSVAEALIILTAKGRPRRPPFFIPADLSSGSAPCWSAT
ncbi:MAG: InlB B-repeat-containing protein [Candidatus Electronema sp. VV]